MIDIIFSIRSEYVKMIFSGEKLAEIRKSKPSRTDINRVWVYEIGTGKVVGFWEWGDIEYNTPWVLSVKYDPNHKIEKKVMRGWDIDKKESGDVEINVMNGYIWDYCVNKKNKRQSVFYALPIKNLTRIQPVPFQNMFPGKKPPQGFLYCEPVDLEKVEVIS
jgi:predicted transcriptional regulator